VITALEAQLQKLKALQDALPVTPEQEQNTADLSNQTQADTREPENNNTGVLTGEEPVTGDVLPVINPEKVAHILNLCNLAIASNFYMSNAKRVAALESALAIPVSDDKSFQQFYTHSEKDLVSLAYNAARKTGGMPTEVTTTLIMAEAHKRYLAKHGKRAVVNEEYEG
jgi:hypothetical protein